MDDDQCASLVCRESENQTARVKERVVAWVSSREVAFREGQKLKNKHGKSYKNNVEIGGVGLLGWLGGQPGIRKLDL
jgi:hypothetical protein